MIKKISRKNKKGSHVGVVVSFVIFITFLVFLYAILEPVTVRHRDKQYILDYLKFNLLGEATGNMTTMLLKVDEPVGPQPCLNLQQIIDGEEPIEEGCIPEYMVNNLMFKTSEEQFTYERNSGNLRVNTGTGFQGIITIIYSEDFEPLPYDGVPGCSPKSYRVGFVRTFSEVFGVKMLQLNETYYLDYKGLKAQLGIPEGTEFNFYVYDGARSEPPIISAEMYPVPTDTTVYVEETPIQYIDENGDTVFGFLLVKIW